MLDFINLIFASFDVFFILCIFAMCLIASHLAEDKEIFLLLALPVGLFGVLLFFATPSDGVDKYFALAYGFGSFAITVVITLLFVPEPKAP